MTSEKGLSEEVADKIGEYVVLKGKPCRCIVRRPDHFLSFRPRI
jgi:hypothetical protein